MRKSRFVIDEGDLVYIKAGSRIRKDNATLSKSYIYVPEEQVCVVLETQDLRQGEFAPHEQYLVFLQQMQIQGWAYKEDLEKIR